MKRPILSPLRYPGGKASLYELLRAVVRTNRLTAGTYVEPYAGGAGAALGLLITGQVSRIVINDLNPSIYAFWKAVVEEPTEFCSLVERAELSVDEWERQKDLYASVDRDDHLRLGFATFYLNRTNRSGSMNAGPIGGKGQSGNYKIDARFTKSTLLERLRLIALYAPRITVTCEDGRDCIERYEARSDVLVYADPPYFEKAGSLYMHSFQDSDHEKLAELLNERSSTLKWVLTYDKVGRVPELYAERRRTELSLYYSAHRVTRATEIMVVSDCLSLPQCLSF
jgi:DNA adenine methylase